MMRFKTLKFAAAAAFACLFLATQAECVESLADLQPVDTLDGFSPEESSVGLWVRFDRGWIPRKASAGSPTGLLDLRLDSHGVPVVVLRARPTEILGDCVMTGRDPVAKGDWHHYEIVFSRAERRAAFYVDGRLQWENALPFLPRLADFAEALREPTEDFRGGVEGLTVWDAPLDVEAVLPVGDEESDPCDTVARQRLAERQAANLATIGDTRGACALYAVDPVGALEPGEQEIPADGELTDEASAVVAPGERAAFSFVLVAKMPLTVRTVVVSDFLGDDGDLPSANCDVRLVKRWFRPASGSSSRVLVPDLLVHDDKLVRVDVCRKRNFLRLSDSAGDTYVDVSDPDAGDIVFRGGSGLAFKDADTLQPVEIPEMGSSRRFFFTMEVARGVRPGTYVSYVRFRTTMGEVSAKLRLRVLDVELPKIIACARDVNRAFRLGLDAEWDAQGGDDGLDVARVPSSGASASALRRAVGLGPWARGADGVRLGRWVDTRHPFNAWRENFVAGAETGGIAWAYPQEDGVLPTLRLEALRAGLADLRWATRLQQLCAAFEDSADAELRAKARRDRLWLRGVGSGSGRLTRVEIQRRLVEFSQVIAEKGAALPPVAEEKLRPVAAGAQPPQAPVLPGPTGNGVAAGAPPPQAPVLPGPAGNGAAVPSSPQDEERQLMQRVASARRKPEQHTVALRALGDFYRARAAELTGAPAQASLEKALRCYEAAINVLPRASRTFERYRPAIQMALTLGNLEKAEQLMGALPSSAQGAAARAAWMGDLAYYRGDYETAVYFYGSVPSLEVRPSVDTRGVCAWDRYAAALYATGRYEQCLEVIPRLANWGSLAARNTLYFECLRRKIGER